MEINLLDRMLSTYRSQSTPVTIVLQNKARVSGRIREFDSYVVIMENQKHEIVYRHAISSLLPSAAAEQAPHPREQKADQARPALKPVKPAMKAAKYPSPASPKQKNHDRPAPKVAAGSPDSGLNNGMKEGLLRWMREQKAGK